LLENDGIQMPATNDSAGKVFVSWWQLRLIYNATLALIVLVFGFVDVFVLDFLWFVARCALGANLCFCLGPVAERYLTLLGVSRADARGLVFVPGLLLACLLTLGAVYFWEMSWEHW
jgi:hypothetical protein